MTKINTDNQYLIIDLGQIFNENSHTDNQKKQK